MKNEANLDYKMDTRVDAAVVDGSVWRERPGFGGLGHTTDLEVLFLDGRMIRSYWLGLLFLMLSPHAMAEVPSSGLPPGEVWECMAREPTIHTVQRWVGESYRAEIRGIQHQPWAALLPHRFRVQLSGNDEGDWYNTFTDDDGWRRRLGGESRLGWRLDAEWDLNQWIYPPKQIARARMIAFSEDRRRARIETATRMYYQRRQHQWTYWTGDWNGSDDRARQWWKIQELTSHLNVITSGRFVSALRLMRCPVAGQEPLP